MVEIKNLTKYYGNRPAVQDISFTVGDHEVLGFLGPNGAGKSTTMNMITGCLPSTSGTVLVDGFDISKDPMEVKRRIGYLPELPPVYTDMRVRNYLEFAAGLKGVKRKDIKAQVENAMERLKITDVQKRLIGNLSKGYRQRVGFAQALLGSPKFIILDEPTVGLDPKQVMEVRQLIQDLAQDHTIIFSTHILAEVSAVCERVVIISKGKIRAVDTIDNLEHSAEGGYCIKMTIEGDITKATNIIRETKGVTELRSVDYVSAGVNTYEILLENDEVRKPLMSALITGDCMVLEVSTVHEKLEEVFVRLTSPEKVSREKMFEELGEELEAQRAADGTNDSAENPYDTKEED